MATHLGTGVGIKEKGCEWKFINPFRLQRTSLANNTKHIA